MSVPKTEIFTTEKYIMFVGDHLTLSSKSRHPLIVYIYIMYFILTESIFPDIFSHMNPKPKKVYLRNYKKIKSTNLFQLLLE